MIVCQKNLYHISKRQKQAHNKGVKIISYVTDDKVCLNSKYINIKQNRKLKAKFFRALQVLYLVDKQAHKLKLSKK